MKSFAVITFFSLFATQLEASMIRYEVFFREPQHHYVHVEMTLDASAGEELTLYMPVWTPGSYMIREFSRYIDMVTAQDEQDNPLTIEKTAKNTWSLAIKATGPVRVSYRVYANELTVRTNHVNIDHAMLNGAPTFLTVKGWENQVHQVRIHPYSTWKVISTALPQLENEWHRAARNYDELVDSPLEIGNHEVIHFEAAGIPHELALVGASNVNKRKLVKELTAIVDEELKLFRKEHPCERYVFILHHTDQTYGGLEHLHSSLNMVPRWNYEPREKYLQSISLLAHEYFHLWNIKRIRPVEFGPFNYNEENYSRQLWVAEGITSYYDDYFVYLAGVSSQYEYLDIVADNINKVVNTPGDTFQALSESSFDTWIKYYRQHENTQNNQVNYYTKGATVVTALNLLILNATKGKRSMDDVMRAMYERYLKNPDKGMTEAEVLRICEDIAGVPLKDFFDRHIYGKEPVDYAHYLAYAGLELKDYNKSGYYIGWSLNNREGKWMVSKVEAGSSAYEAGLNAEDEILAINGYRMSSNWEHVLFGSGVGSEVELLISRAGIVRSVKMKLLPDIRRKYRINVLEEITPLQKKIRNAWLVRSGE